jgi:anti-anti-sigma factor
MAFLTRLFPFLRWFEKYNTAILRADLISGVTVALVLIPQSMAYAQLAGLPAYYGLYAAFLPPMVASMFGSSHQLATGPVAVVSLMTSAALSPIAAAGSPQYIAYAILLALLVGLFQFFLGVFRLGLIVNFLSHPVVNGFTNAAALIIATSQLSKIFGVYVDSAEHHYETIYRVVLAAFDYTHWPTFGMAVIAFATMIGLKKLNPRIPNVLVAVIITTLLSWVMGFQKNEKVTIERLQSDRVRELVTDFNGTVLEREEAERLRTEGNEALQSGDVADPEGHEVCTSCHGRRESGFDWKGAELEGERSGFALALHHAAGLLDLRVTQLKERESELRTELRGLRFEAVRGIDDGLDFYIAGEKPEGSTREAGVWRIRVGGSSVDEQALTMTGGGAVVAEIPEGLPKIAFPAVDIRMAFQLFVVAMVISILGFMEAISIAKAMAARTHQRLDPDQELIGQGLANIIGCMGQSYAVSGSFSRSAVNLQAGAQTGLSNVFSSGVVVIVLLFFTPLLYHLPQAVLAAIIMMAVIGLLNVEGFVHAWKAQRFDGFTGVASFVATLAFAPHLEWGIALGVVLSLGAYLYRTMKPPVPELSLHPDGTLKDAERHQLRRCRHIVAIRFDGPLNFANTSYLEDKVLELVADMPDLKHVLVAAHGINEVDASGEDMLRLLVERLREAGYMVSFSGLKEEVLDTLKRTGLYERIGEENMYPTQAHAVAANYAKAHAGSKEKDCPLQSMRPRVVDVSLHADGSMKDAHRYGLKACRHIAVIRFEGSLDLASANYLEEKVNERIVTMPDLKNVLIAADGINQIDSFGVETLARLVQRLRESGLEICFSGFSDSMVDILKKFHTYDVIREENFHPSQAQAIRFIYARAHDESTEEDCPLQALSPRVAELSLHPDGSLRDAKRWELGQCKHISALRFDGPLDVATSDFFLEKIEERVGNMPDLKHVFFAAHRINRMDAYGAGTIKKAVRWLRDAGYEVSFSGLADDVLDVLKERSVYETIEESNIYPTQILAIRHIYDKAHADSSEADCPLEPLRPYLAELSLHTDGSLHDAKRRNLDQCEHIAALRFDGPLDIASAEYFLKKVESCVAERPKLKHVFFAAHRINLMDSHGAEAIKKAVRWLRDSGYDVSFSGFSDVVVDLLKEKRVYEIIGEDNIHPTQIQAIRHIYSGAHEDSVEVGCPLEPLSPYIAELSLYVDGTMRDSKRYGLPQCARIAALRFDGSLDAAGSSFLEQKVEERIANMPYLKHVFFAAHRIHHIDEHGANVLRRIIQRLRKAEFGVSFSGFAENVLDLLDKFDLSQLIGKSNLYPTQVLAIRHIYAKAHVGSTEENCPLESLKPIIAELALHSDGSFRDATRHGLRQCEHIAALRFDGPVDMASADSLEEKVEERIKNMPNLKHVFFAAHRADQIDAHGAEVLERVVKRLRDAGYGFSISGLSDEVLGVLQRNNLYELIGEDNVYPTQAVAIESIHAKTHENSKEAECPLLFVVPEASKQ